MKSIYLSLFLLLLTYQISFAQSASIDWGPVSKAEEGYFDEGRFLHYDNSGYVFASQMQGWDYPSYYKVLLEKYDLKHHLIFSKVVIMKTPEEKNRKNHGRYVGALQMGDSTIIFMTDYYPFNNTKFLYATTYGPNGETGRTIIVDTLQDKSSSAAFKLIRTKDQTKFWICATQPFISKDNSILHVKMFNTELKTVWSLHKTLPFASKDYTMSNCVVTEDGSVYAAFAKHPFASVEKGDKKNKPYQLYGYQSSSGKEIKMDLNQGNADYISELKLHYQEGLLYVAGYYGTATKKDDYDEKISRDGICLQVINLKNMETIQDSKTPFDSNHLRNIIGDYETKKGNKIPGSYTIYNIIPSQNKGVIIVGESVYQNHMESRISTRGNILVTMLDPQGHIVWSHTIWKKRAILPIENVRLSNPSYLVYIKGNSVYLFHEEGVKNQNITPTFENIKVIDLNDDRYLALTTFNPDGVWHKRKYVTEMKSVNDDTELDIRDFYQIDDEHLFIGAHGKKNSHKFGIMTIK